MSGCLMRCSPTSTRCTPAACSFCMSWKVLIPDSLTNMAGFCIWSSSCSVWFISVIIFLRLRLLMPSRVLLFCGRLMSDCARERFSESCISSSVERFSSDAMASRSESCD